MDLGEYIALLKNYPDKDKVLPIALGDAISWRGVYAELAFEPTSYRSVRQMLEEAENALDAIFEGYKGGEYRMNANTEIHIDHYGRWTDGKQAASFINSIDPFIDTEGRTEEWLVAKAIDLMLGQAGD